jgi:hypothetical protein
MDLELLVKLANLGTAGVCVLAIFYIGTIIPKIPNNAPAWKPALMKKYMNMCIVVAIICAFSGGVNAYFNRNKIAAANGQVARLSAGYEDQLKRIGSEKREISASFDSLKGLLSQEYMLKPAIHSALDSTKSKIDRLQFSPKEEFLKVAVVKPIKG